MTLVINNLGGRDTYTHVDANTHKHTHTHTHTHKHTHILTLRTKAILRNQGCAGKRLVPAQFKNSYGTH